MWNHSSLQICDKNRSLSLNGFCNTKIQFATTRFFNLYTHTFFYTIERDWKCQLRTNKEEKNAYFVEYVFQFWRWFIWNQAEEIYPSKDARTRKKTLQSLAECKRTKGKKMCVEVDSTRRYMHYERIHPKAHSTINPPNHRKCYLC